MDAISNKAFAAGYLGGGLLLVVHLAMVMTLDGGWVIPFAMATSNLWWLGFAQMTFSMVPEPHIENEMEPMGMVASTKMALGEVKATLSDIKSFRTLFFYMLAYFCFIDGINSVTALAGVFGIVVLNDHHRSHLDHPHHRVRGGAGVSASPSWPRSGAQGPSVLAGLLVFRYRRCALLCSSRAGEPRRVRHAVHLQRKRACTTPLPETVSTPSRLSPMTMNNSGPSSTRPFFPSNRTRITSPVMPLNGPLTATGL